MKLATLEPGDMTRYIVGCQLLPAADAALWQYNCPVGLVLFGTTLKSRIAVFPFAGGVLNYDDFHDMTRHGNPHTAYLSYMATCHILKRPADSITAMEEIDKMLISNWRSQLPELR